MSTEEDPDFNKLFQRVKKYVDYTDGIFLEAGAYDGIFQSYTYQLEKKLNWSGVLVEPSINAYESCRVNRNNSTCINAALCKDSSITAVVGDFDGSPMSSINGKRLNRHPSIEVPALTLTHIFSTYLKDKEVDLMSIDVENFEYEVLQGLDFSLYRPKYILIEAYTPTLNELFAFLASKEYKLIENITNFNTVEYPNWDGTHNDYLFKKI